MIKSKRLSLYLKTLAFAVIFALYYSLACALNTVQFNPQYYPNPDKGKPISLGSIYVGIPDLDPVIPANQKQITIIQEDGTRVEVSQPVNTNAGGTPTYLGSVVTLMVDGDYSLKVLDSYGSQVYYVPFSAEYIGLSVFTPDYNASDQGITGDNNTIKYYGDQAAGDAATIHFIHNSGAATTTYTFITAWEKPENITLKVDAGVIISGPITGLKSANPAWFGFLTDSTYLENTAAFTATIAAAEAGSMIVIPPGEYAMSAYIDINKSLTISGYGVTFNWPSDLIESRGIKIHASDVEIYGIKLDGPQALLSANLQFGIIAVGASASDYISGIKIKDTKLTNWNTGIRFEFVENFEISNNYVYDNYYTGIATLSVLQGRIINNEIDGIAGPLTDQVTGDLAYGIVVSKSTGTLAVKPLSEHVIVQGNVISNNYVWEGLDTHGGQYLSFVDNKIYNCRTGILVGGASNTGAIGSVPVGCVISNNTVKNDHGTGEIIDPEDQTHGIIVTGNAATEAPATVYPAVMGSNMVVTGNSIEGFGREDNTDEIGGLTIRAIDGMTANNNVIKDSYGHGIVIRSVRELNCSNNVIDGLTADDTQSKAVGTITFSGNPVNGDNIRFNYANASFPGAIYTFVDPAAPTTDYEIDIKATLALTLVETIRILNLSHGDVDGLVTDGRVSIATYTTDEIDTITITFDKQGRIGEWFSYSPTLEAASTANSNLICAQTAGGAGIYIRWITAGEYSSGLISDNTISVGGYTGVFMGREEAEELDFINNRNLGTGILYDLTTLEGISPNISGGVIDPIGLLYFGYAPPAITAGASYVFQVPMFGLNSSWALIDWSAQKYLEGLVVSIQPSDNYCYVHLYNPTADTITIGTQNWRFRYGQIRNRN